MCVEIGRKGKDGAILNDPRYGLRENVENVEKAREGLDSVATFPRQGALRDDHKHSHNIVNQSKMASKPIWRRTSRIYASFLESLTFSISRNAFSAFSTTGFEIQQDPPIEFNELQFDSEGTRIVRCWIDSTDPQVKKYYQMMYKSTCWEDIQRSLEGSPKNSLYMAMAWNTLKMVPNGMRASRELMETMVDRTLQVTASMNERDFASVWHSMARLNVVDSKLLESLTQRAIQDSQGTSFLKTFSPRHLMNVLYALAKIYRRAKIAQVLNASNEAFPMQNAFAEILIKESFRKLNQFNETDLASLSASMGILEISNPVQYNLLAYEVQADIHLIRFSEQNMVNVAFGLTTGGGLDLFEACPIFTQELLTERRLTGFSYRQLALIARCFSTAQKRRNGYRLLPLLRKLIHPIALPQLNSLELRSAVVALGCFKIDDRSIWETLLNHLKEHGFSEISNFDLTCVYYSMGVVRFYDREILDKIAMKILKDPETIQNFSRLGLSNCFFGIGSLKYINEPLISALCDAVDRKEILESFTPSQFANVVFSLGQIGYKHGRLIRSLVSTASNKFSKFPNRFLLHFAFGLSLDIFSGTASDLTSLFEELFTKTRLETYSNAELGMAICALSKLRPDIGHRWPSILEELLKHERLRSFALIDLVRIVRSIKDLQRPVPNLLQQTLLQMAPVALKELPNRSLLDFLFSLDHLDQGDWISDLEKYLRDTITENRLTQMRPSELSELLLSLSTLSAKLDLSLASLLETILERTIVHGMLRSVSSNALYFALSTLGHERRRNNVPVLSSLATECSKPRRLETYTEQMLSGIFYNLSILGALHGTAFQAFVKQIVSPERLGRYREHHILKIFKGLSIGKHPNQLVVNTLFNAFLHRAKDLSPMGVCCILFNLALLDCWKEPFVQPLLRCLSSSSDWSAFSMWDLGIVTYTLGRKQHRDMTIMELICQQLTKERLVEATDADLANFVQGFGHLKIDHEAATTALLSECLKHSRCMRYTNRQICAFLQSFAEWQMVEPSQLAGLIEPLKAPERCSEIGNYHAMTILNALVRLHLMEENVVGNLLKEITRSDDRIQHLEPQQLYQLSLFAHAASASDAVDRIQKHLNKIL